MKVRNPAKGKEPGTLPWLVVAFPFCHSASAPHLRGACRQVDRSVPDAHAARWPEALPYPLPTLTSPLQSSDLSPSSCWSPGSPG